MHQYSVDYVARAFFDTIVRPHRVPSTIVLDRDAVFTLTFWQELFKAAGVRVNMSTTFHPQFDGQSESVNRVIAMYLHYLTGD